MRTLPLWLLLALPTFGDQAAVDKIKADHGISLSISGMVIVFVGLAGIAGFISLLPKVLKWMEKQGWTPAAHGHGHGQAVSHAKPAPVLSTPVAAGVMDAGTLAAITLVLHAEAERAIGQQLKVTIGLHPSPWALSNHMRTIPGRIK
jgi:hypothetical protein